MSRIFCYVSHTGGVLDDAAPELAAAAAKLDPAATPIALVTGWGADLDSAADVLRCWYSEVWKISAEALAYANAELVRQALTAVLPPGAMVLVAHNHFGIDLSPGLSIKLDAAYVSDVVDIERVDGARLHVVRQEFGGQLSTHVVCDASTGAVLNTRPGAFQPLPALAARGQIAERPAGDLRARRRYISTVAAEAGDIDITKYKVLVSIGRGIQDPDNVKLAEELAEAVGGAVSCSRPVVDAKWMDKARQVGSSGKTVKPKVYLACGISGSFQHLAGIKGGPLIIAINKNPNAPIFRVAGIGVVDDILEFLPELTRRVQQKRAVGVK
jgi:electron transfer flavoprotein alpha subunit